MEITINNSILSVEFGKTKKSTDIEELNKRMKVYFKDKSYLNVVEEYFIAIICVSPGFDEFFKPKRPKYYDDKIINVKGLPEPDDIHMKHHFYCEIKLDFYSFFPSNQQI